MLKRIQKQVCFVLIFCFANLSGAVFAQDYAGASSAPQADIQSHYLYSPQEMKAYTLSPGDNVELAVIIGDNARTLDYKFVITPMGEVYIPNIGVVEVMGLSINDAKAKIDTEIKKYFKESFRSYLMLIQPQITHLKMQGDAITIPYTQKYVYVYGEVTSPGRFAYLPGSKLSDYLNFAGGPTGRAILTDVNVARNVSGKPQAFTVDADGLIYKGIKDKDVDIMAGDIIKVPANFFYFTDFSSFANTIMLGVTLFFTAQTIIK